MKKSQPGLVIFSVFLFLFSWTKTATGQTASKCPQHMVGPCPIAFHSADGPKPRLKIQNKPARGYSLPGNSDQPPILFSIIMHNEEATPYHLNRELFVRQRNALVVFAEMLHAHQVKFNFQADWTFLQAVHNFDSDGAFANTHGRNIIRWLLEDLGFEVDPHAHETQCNYADVALLLETVSGAPASKIAGGMIAGPPDCSVLEQFWVPITSTVYPSYSWQPEVIWGGGTPGHQQEEALWYSGVWRPKARNHFGTHDPTKPVLNIGKYGANWTTLDHLLQRQKKGELVPDRIHTASISLETEHLLQPLYIETFADEIKKRKSENIIWLGLAEIADLWKGESYNQEPNIVAYLWFRSYLPLLFAPLP